MDLTYSDMCLVLSENCGLVYIFIYISAEWYLQLFIYLKFPNSSLDLTLTESLESQKATSAVHIYSKLVDQIWKKLSFFLCIYGVIYLFLFPIHIAMLHTECNTFVTLDLLW